MKNIRHLILGYERVRTSAKGGYLLVKEFPWDNASMHKVVQCQIEDSDDDIFVSMSYKHLYPTERYHAAIVCNYLTFLKEKGVLDGGRKILIKGGSTIKVENGRTWLEHDSIDYGPMHPKSTKLFSNKYGFGNKTTGNIEYWDEHSDKHIWVGVEYIEPTRKIIREKHHR